MKAVVPRLKEQYDKTIAPELMKEFGVENLLAVPRLKKITLNVGVGKMAYKDAKIIDKIVENISVITGQKPFVAKAKKSIAAFKLREGQPVGVAVTLRGPRMYEFMDRLVNVALPRVRDFRGLNPDSFDDEGNYSLGIKEHSVFPEATVESLDAIHGLQINITVSTHDADMARALLKKFGMPFSTK
ncbi:MAG: 50S ribosomal protein L5 [Patescibacteria group bacterium]